MDELVSRRRLKRTTAQLALPVGLLALLLGAFVLLDPLQPAGALPPLERLTVERTVLDDAGISLLVRAGGPDPVAIAQVQVDEAYWTFEQKPAGAIAPLERARIDIPYPWTRGADHHVRLVSQTGATFDRAIERALPTPTLNPATLLRQALVGLYVGLVPVGTGMLFYPALRQLGRRGLEFVLALTLGLLAYLLVDTAREGLALSAQATSALSAGTLLWIAAGLTFAALLAVGRRGGAPPQGKALARYLALGIGWHNLGEGLAIGAAFATGEIALGSFLVLGFALHNLTEGIGIAAPLAKLRPRLATFARLAALAGTPAIAGIWLGAFAFSPHWAALFLGVGAGAILQVLVEVGAYLQRLSPTASLLSARSLAGSAAGAAIMYGTSLAVQV